MPTNILVLHGPNLNLLGTRKGDVPERTLEALDRQIRERALTLGLEVKIHQSNHEGGLLDALHSERKWAHGLLISPGALARTAFALAEAVAWLDLPALEIHLDEYRDEDGQRKRSALKSVVRGRVFGQGFDSYLVGLDRFVTGEWDGGKAKAKAKARAEAKTLKAVRKPSPDTADEGPAPRAATSALRTPRTPDGKRALGRAGRAEKSFASPRADVKSEKTLGPSPRGPKAEFEKSLGRKEKAAWVGLSRAQVRQWISDRLAGRVSPTEMAAWARARWLDVQGGSAVEGDARELFLDTLQTLMTAAAPKSKLTDEQLVELLARLAG